MLDLAFIRNNPDIVKEAARVKNNTLDIDHLLEVDRQVLALQRQVEEVRAEQNQISKRVQQAGKDKELRDTLIAQGKQLAEQIKALEPRLRELEDERQQLLYYVPNIPDPSAPIGKDENDNVPFKYWGEPPQFDFEPLDHYALMQKLDVVDIERAVKVAGARSYALKGDAARLSVIELAAPAGVARDIVLRARVANRQLAAATAAAHQAGEQGIAVLRRTMVPACGTLLLTILRIASARSQST